MKSMRLKFKSKPPPKKTSASSSRADSQRRGSVLRSASSPVLHILAKQQYDTELDNDKEVRGVCVYHSVMYLHAPYVSAIDHY